MSQISQIKKIYHAAIYVRLSKEDGAVASHEKAESNSIANQKSLIREFLKSKNDIVIEQEYVDDGFSGSNFERPAFQMMLEASELFLGHNVASFLVYGDYATFHIPTRSFAGLFASPCREVLAVEQNDCV